MTMTTMTMLSPGRAAAWSQASQHHANAESAIGDALRRFAFRLESMKRLVTMGALFVCLYVMRSPPRGS